MPEKITEVERVHLTLPVDVLDAIKEIASSEDRSLSAEVTRRLRKSLKGQQR